MIGYWISFALLFPFILFAVPYSKIQSVKMFKIKLTPEMDKVANMRVVIMILYLWLWNFFYMAIFTNNMICKYIFGGLIMIIIFMDLGNAMSYPRQRNWLERWLMAQDFIVGTVLTVYLIYIIPIADVKEIVIPIVAAVYGGLLTLVGVILTIKKSDKDRKEDEIKKARPVFAYNMLRQEPKLDAVVQRVCISDSSEQLQDACDVYVELENSNLSSFEIKRVNHDGTWVKMEGNTTVLPSAKCLLNFRFIDNPNSLFLEVEDQLGNNYYYQLFVLFLGTKSSNGMALHTVREIKSITKEEIEMIIKEAK